MQGALLLESPGLGIAVWFLGHEEHGVGTLVVV